MLGGGINTALTYTLYVILNFFLSYHVAYALAFVAGIIFSYWFNSSIVFKASFSIRKAVSFPLVYIAQYFISAALLSILVEKFSLDENLAPLLVVAAMIPATYIASKLVLTNKKDNSHYK